LKNIILTGDTGDLGGAILKHLLKKRYFVIGISRRKRSEIKNPNYLHLSFDLAEPEKIKDLYINKIKSTGSIFGLINNAAYPYDDIVTNASIEQLDLTFKINVISPIILTKYALRDMLLHDIAGSIVHISSVSAHTGYNGLSMYAASKGAIEAFSKTVAREWGERGIRSNCIAPGFMETNMTEALTQDQKQKIYRRTALKEQTDARVVAKTTEFVLSDDSKSITGTTIHVDSGTI